MRTPLIDRREFLKAAGAAFLPRWRPRLATTLQADAVFATAYQRRDGSYGAAVLSEAGKILHRVDLPDRGHDVTFDPVSRPLGGLRAPAGHLRRRLRPCRTRCAA